GDARPESDVAIQRATSSQGVVVIGGDERPVRYAVQVEQTERALLDPRVDVGAGLERHDETHAVPEALEDLGEGLDSLAPEAPAEPAAGVEAFQLPDRAVSHPSLTVRRPLQIVVVDDDDLLIGRLLDVEPQSVDPRADRRLVGGDRMLGRDRGSP